MPGYALSFLSAVARQADIEKLKAAASEGGSPDKASLQLIKEKAMAR